MGQWKWRFFGMITALIAAAGCSQFKSDSDKIRIGAIMPLTGPFAAYGQAVTSGMKLYVSQAAARGRDIELIVIDNRSDPAVSQQAYQTLVATHHVPVVVGAYSSANTLPLKPLALKSKVPVVTPTATNDAVTDRNPYLFRTCFNDTFQAMAIAWYARNRAGMSRIGILLNLDVEGGDYSRGLAHATASAFEKAGGKVVKEVGFTNGQKSFAAQLKELHASGVKSVFAPLYPADVITLLRDAAASGYGLELFGGDGWAEPEVLGAAGPAAAGSFYACMFADEHTAPQTVTFVADARKHGLIPDMCTAQGYDTVGILDSIMTSGSTAEEIRAALGKVHDYPGATGTTTIRHDGNAVKPVYIKMMYRDKNLNRLEDRVIYIVKPSDIRQ